MMKYKIEGKSWLGGGLAVLLFVAGCSNHGSPGFYPGDSDTGAVSCTEGSRICQSDKWMVCEGETWVESSDCGASGLVCVNDLGCVPCVPGEAACSEEVVSICRPDGSGLDEFACEVQMGLDCQPNGCFGPCSPETLRYGYYGCDFMPTVTLNPVWSGFDFAVAIANTSDEVATVNVTGPQGYSQTLTISSQGIEVVVLPWVSQLKGGEIDACQNPPEPGATRVVKGGAYRIKTDVPVAVYQFNPLSYEIAPAPSGCPLGRDCPGGSGDRCLSYSNDATLLLPLTGLTGNYDVLSWPSIDGRAAFTTIVASSDDTTVKVTGRGTFVAGAGIDHNGDGTVSLDAGDVLEIVSDYTAAQPDQWGPDPSGTRIRADKPVQVIAGNSCASVPQAETLACDHVEHSLLPTETAGKDYFVTCPAAVASLSPYVVRVLAIEEETEIVFDPPILDPAILGPQDEPLEIDDLTQDVHIRADKPILVAHFMQGQGSVPSGSGDPSMSVAIPSEQFRTQFVFATPSTFDSSFLNVVAPAGAAVMLDGVALTPGAFAAIGSSGYTAVRIELDGAETHVLESDEKIGAVVYGYGQYASYMYPAGADLRHIALAPI